MNVGIAPSGERFAKYLDSRYIKRSELYKFLKEEFGPEGNWKVTVENDRLMPMTDFRKPWY